LVTYRANSILAG